MIQDKLKEIVNLQDIIKKDDLNEEDADNKQSKFATELKNLD